MPHHARPANSHPLVTAHSRAGRASPQRFKRTVLACAIGYACATGLAAVTFPGSALAADAPAAQTQRKAYAIPAGPLEAALNRFGREANVLLSFPTETTAGRQSPGLRGNYAVQEALSLLLQGTGLAAVVQANGSYTLVAVARREGDGNAVTTLPSVTVTADSVTNFDVDDGFKAEYQTTATKSPLTLRETPQSISVITQDSIEARQAITLGQAVETAAGVTPSSEPGPFAGRSATGFTTFEIRGVQAPFYFAQLEDGFFAPQLTGSRDLAPYERVEVVKGPSSVLYGRGSAGGFLNLVTKKPLPEFRAEIAPTLGSFDFYRLDADVTGPLFESDKARGRLVLAYEDAGSFVDFAESERLVISPSLEFNLTDSTRLLLQGIYQDDSFDAHYGVPLQRTGRITEESPDGEDFKAPDVRRSLFFGVPDEDGDNSTRELLTGTVQLDQQLGDRWLATLRLNAQSPEQSIAQGSYAYSLTPAGETTLFNSVFENEADVWTGEFRLNGEVDLFGRPANIVVGAERNDFDYHRRDAYMPLGTANIYEENFDDIPIMDASEITTRDTDFKGTGVYGQVQFRPIERLSILMGGRYDWADTVRVTTPEATGIAAESEQEDKEFTWRAGATFDLSTAVSVYGLYAQSFAPEIFSTSRDGALNPETGEIYEAGLKTEWFDGKLGINAALFRIERDDVGIPDPTNEAGEFFSVNAGLQRNDGFELEINGEPLPGWNISFGGILLDAEFIERDDPNVGNAPRNAADWQVGLFTSYELQSGPLQGLGFGAGLFAIDQRPVTESSPGTIDGYERVDLQVFYNGFENTKIALQVRNVFDEKYIETLERPNALNHFGAPASVLLTVRHSFGK